jgi:predicted acyl esterase
MNLFIVLVVCIGIVSASLHDIVEKGKDKIHDKIDSAKEHLRQKLKDMDKKVMEDMIPMRDGVQLHTWVGMPRGWKKGDPTFPAVMDRSPYGYSDMEWFADIFVPFGFVGVSQDIRGTEKSMGNYTMWQGEENDSRDLGDWIVSQPWSNGEIYTIGASADGIASLQTYKSKPDWLKAQYVMVAPNDPYDILIPTGAFKQSTVVDWLNGLTYGVDDPDGAQRSIQIVYENEGPTTFWDQVSEKDDFFATVNYPTAIYGGWWDLFLKGSLATWTGFNTLSTEDVRGTSKIFLDPCGHCTDAQEFFPGHTVEGRSLVFVMQLFELFGVRKFRRDAIKQISFYVMSSNDDAGLAAGQYWTSMDAWPVPKMTDYFLISDGNGARTISTTAPTAAEGDAAASTSYKVDPENPIYGNGGANLPPSVGGSISCGPLDQQNIDNAGRTDLLLFDVPINDGDLVLTGEMNANLFVSSDAIDTDFMVRIEDVYNNADGTVRLLQDNAVRMRWREGTTTPVYMDGADTVYNIQMELWNTSYIMPEGHTLRVSIQSSNNPRFSVNAQNGILLADPAYPGAAVTAINTIHHSAKYPSKLSLPIITDKEGMLPKVELIKEIKHELKDEVTDKVLEKVGDFLKKRIARHHGKGNHKIIDKLINH